MLTQNAVPDSLAATAVARSPAPRFGDTADRTDHSFPSTARYRRGLELCRDWLLASTSPLGGSRAHFSPVSGWSKAYPETTGYIVGTLLALGTRLGDPRASQTAVDYGNWLVSIQETEGFWRGGLYPYARDARPSVFNTGQILQGLVALARDAAPSERKWREAAAAAANWLAAGVGADGQWREGHYREHQPTYYTFVAWPMLEYAKFARDGVVEEAAERVLGAMLARRLANGSFSGWGFSPSEPAYTHTIAYTVQGFLECARLTANNALAVAVGDAVERLRRSAERSNGRLPGRFSEDGTPDKRFECVTGSAQTATCLMLLHQLEPDLRLINGAAKLVDRVCQLQSRIPVKSLRGAIPGSNPLWGRYMRMRYPNWAVKFHADSLMMLSDLLVGERVR
jgi:hypothetical protein